MLISLPDFDFCRFAPSAPYILWLGALRLLDQRHNFFLPFINRSPPGSDLPQLPPCVKANVRPASYSPKNILNEIPASLLKVMEAFTALFISGKKMSAKYFPLNITHIDFTSPSKFPSGLRTSALKICPSPGTFSVKDMVPSAAYPCKVLEKSANQTKGKDENEVEDFFFFGHSYPFLLI